MPPRHLKSWILLVILLAHAISATADQRLWLVGAESFYDLQKAGMVRGVDASTMTEAVGIANRQVLQDALDRLKIYAGNPIRTVLYLPAGRWAIAGTSGTATDSSGATFDYCVRVPPQLQGGTLIGAGRAPIHMVSENGAGGGNSNGGQYSALVYVGSAPASPTVLFAADACRDFILTGISLHGRPVDGDTKHPNLIGLAVTKSEGGVGSGHHTFSELYIDKCGRAISLGIEPADANNGNNNDYCTFNQIFIEDCTDAIALCATNVLAHEFNRLFVYEVTRVVEIFGGGNLTINGGFSKDHPASFFRFRDIGGGSATTSSSNGRFICRDWCAHGVEEGAYRTMWVDASEYTGGESTIPSAWITFEHLDNKPTDGELQVPHFDLFGRMRLELNSCWNIETGSILMRERNSNLYPFVSVNKTNLGSPTATLSGLRNSGSGSDNGRIKGVSNYTINGTSGGMQSRADEDLSFP